MLRHSPKSHSLYRRGYRPASRITCDGARKSVSGLVDLCHRRYARVDDQRPVVIAALAPSAETLRIGMALSRLDPNGKIEGISESVRRNVGARAKRFY